MTTYEQRIERDGFCVIEQVIPEAVVGEICAELAAVVERNRQHSDATLAEIRRRGHRIGTPGVANLKQVINQVQSFAPYLAARRLMDVIESFFGPWARISCTDCVVNHPGNARGYWHADWPYNSTNASHIPAPYPDAVLHLSTIWMLTPFAAETGGTFVVPGSHRWPRNPAAGDMPAMDQDAPYPTECQIEGDGRQRPSVRQSALARGGPQPERKRSRRSPRALRPVVVEPESHAHWPARARGDGGGDWRQKLRDDAD